MDKTMLFLAEKLAKEKHAGQYDKAGQPYIKHVQFVAEQMKTDLEKTVAWLHDVVEDTDVTLGEIYVEFGEEVALAVETLTRKKHESYADFIVRVKNNNLACKVKIADLNHNMDLSRLKEVSASDLKRLEKYQKALAFLKG